MEKSLTVYIKQFKVYANEVDLNAKVKITTLLDYLQNTAWEHYNEFEKQYGKILPDNLKWAILKLKLKILRLPRWEESIKVKTWAPFVDKYFAYRNFEILDEKDNAIGQSTFNWVVIDAINKKIVMPKQFADKWQFCKTPLFFEIKGKVEKLTDIENSREILVSYSDIDMNNHVNNVKYVQWVVDCIGYEIMKEKVIQEIEVNFISEAVINNRLSINIQKLSDNPVTYIGNIERNDDKKELCRVKIIL